MHILFLTDNFPPETNAPAARTYEHAREWAKLGHAVTVITCAPNFPDGVVFDGYRNKLYQREVMGGIDVVRVKTYLAANEGFARRLLDYLSFGVMGTIAALCQRRPDVIVATSPQFFCACAGWLVSIFRRKPWVFELRDIWPSSITAVGAMKAGFIIRVLEQLEMFLYGRADRIVVVTNSFKAELIARGIEDNKIDVVINGVDLSRYSPARCKNSELADQYELKAKFVLGYVGTHGMAHALDKVMAAAELLAENDNIRFLFVGGGAEREKLEKMALRKNLRNVLLLPRQPKEAMPDIWSLCDVSLISLRDSLVFAKVIPSKIFESMGMGLPMIICCPKGEATKIIERSAAGLVVEPENPQALAHCVTELFNDRQQIIDLSRASGLAAAEFDRKQQALLMLESLEKVATLR